MALELKFDSAIQPDMGFADFLVTAPQLDYVAKPLGSQGDTQVWEFQNNILPFVRFTVAFDLVDGHLLVKGVRCENYPENSGARPESSFSIRERDGVTQYLLPKKDSSSYLIVRFLPFDGMQWRTRKQSTLQHFTSYNNNCRADVEVLYAAVHEGQGLAAHYIAINPNDARDEIMLYPKSPDVDKPFAVFRAMNPQPLPYEAMGNTYNVTDRGKFWQVFGRPTARVLKELNPAQQTAIEEMLTRDDASWLNLTDLLILKTPASSPGAMSLEAAISH